MARIRPSYHPTLAVMMLAPVDFENAHVVEAARSLARSLRAWAVITVGRARTHSGREIVDIEVENVTRGLRVRRAEVVERDGTDAELTEFQALARTGIALPLAPWPAGWVFAEITQ